VNALAQIERWLELYGGDRVDVFDLLCDSHVADVPALLFEDGDGKTHSLTYDELGERAKRLAGSLAEQGVGADDRVAVLMAKSPQLLISLLAIWRLGAVHVPLFTAFGPDAVRYRLEECHARVLIVDAARRATLGPEVTSHLTVFCLGATGRDIDLDGAIEKGRQVPAVARAGDDAMVLLFTSGTTGNPKGVQVPVRALASFRSYMEHGLAVDKNDIYWNMADPGWAYGLYFGVLGPLLLGQRILWRGGGFDARDAFAAIARYQVTNLAAAPTVYRALRAAGAPSGFRDAHGLRVVSSAGEPLNAELISWSRAELGVAIHDHYGQSELGMAVYFSHHPDLATDPLPGSMGHAAPGYRAVVLGDHGEERTGSDGELAIDTAASPQYWFPGYYGDPGRTAERFRFGPRYYLTGDSARQDQTGLLFFASRADDVITTSGYRVGPFEVESALLAHPAVVEAAVVGIPDELRGEAVTAIVVTTPESEHGAALAGELQCFVKARLAKHLYPRHISFVGALPKTPSGKVQRRLIRERWDDADDALHS
jgi:acetyl-CoA synthetase